MKYILLLTSFNLSDELKYCIPLLLIGCRSSPVNLEARSLSGWGTSRHCVVARLEDITIDQFREVRSRAGALLVMLPQQLSDLSDDVKQVKVFLIVYEKMSLNYSSVFISLVFHEDCNDYC